MKKGGQQRVPRKTKQPGLPPGTLVHVGMQRVSQAEISVISYDELNLTEQKVANGSQARLAVQGRQVNWINVSGLHDTKLIEELGAAFGIHSLALEDIVNTEHRPKYEEYDDYSFIILKALRYVDSKVQSEHICIILGKNYVITFQEKPGNTFGLILDRMRAGRKIRRKGSDYLTYAIIDNIVDHYYELFEQITDDITDLENKSLSNPEQETMQSILQLKREISLIHKGTWPVREVVSALTRGESKFITKETLLFLRDVYDHSVQVMESVQTFREMISSIMDMYMTSVSNKMNEVMKVLTIIATIFIPLTFLAGVYGMNFTHMPELSWKYGYLLVWIIMLGVGISLVWFFRKRKWI